MSGQNTPQSRSGGRQRPDTLDRTVPLLLGALSVFCAFSAIALASVVMAAIALLMTLLWLDARDHLAELCEGRS